ncbi:MAG: DUF4440 domain-containing protein [Thermoanaerobaculia bacterium]
MIHEAKWRRRSGAGTALLAVTLLAATPAGAGDAGATATADGSGGGRREATKQELLRIDREFSRVSGEVGIVEALYRYQAEDSFLMNSATTTREATHETNRGHFDDRRIVHTPHFAEVAESGDLGYTWGDWSSTALEPDSDGKRDTFGGAYVNIWKRQGDGSWKLVVDGVTRLPAPELVRFRAQATP